MVVGLWPLLAWVATADAAKVELQARGRDLEVGQRTRIVVEVTDATPTGVPRLELPDGLSADYVGQGQNTTVINNKLYRSSEYTYEITAMREGDWAIPGVRVEVGGKWLQSDGVEFHVKPHVDAQGAEQLQLFADFDAHDAWVGQIVVYRYGFRSRQEVLQSGWKLPPLDGFVPPRDGDRPRHEYSIDDPDGRVQVDETFLPFVAAGLGKHDVAGAVARLVVREGGASTGLRLLTPSKSYARVTAGVSIDVKPLPAAPPGFSGLVGDFTIDSDLDVTQAEVGDSVPWHVVFVGNGSLEGYSLPKLDGKDQLQVYDSSPTLSATVQDGSYLARGTFERVLVPTRAGRVDLPPLSIITFSPTQGKYVTQEIRVPPLQVVPGHGAGGSDVSSYAEPVADDLGPVDGVHDIARSGWDTRWALGSLAWPLLALLALPAAGVGVGQGWRQSRAAWARWRQRRAARPQDPRQRLRTLPASGRERLALFDAVLRESLGRRLRSDGALDRAAALATLPADEALPLQALFDDLDRARFADGAPPPDLEARAREAIDLLLRPAKGKAA